VLKVLKVILAHKAPQEVEVEVEAEVEAEEDLKAMLGLLGVKDRKGHKDRMERGDLTVPREGLE